MTDDLSRELLSRLPDDDRAAVAALPSQDILAWTTTRSLQTRSYLLQLHIFHNSLLTVNRLPVELLSKIFLLLRDTSDELSIKWIWVCHVCSTWRAVALSTGRLWSKVNMARPLDFARHCFQYSRDALVDVFAPPTLAKTKPALEEIAPHAHRVRSLRWSLRRFTAAPPFFAALSFSMVRLESLELQGDTVFPFAISRRATLTREMLPSLCSLVLNYVYTPLNAALCSNLRKLELHGRSHQLSLSMLFDILRACPGLEHLVLAACTLRAIEEVQSPEEQIELPELQTLMLDDEMTKVAQMVTSISIPASTHISLTCRIDLDGDLGIVGLLDSVLGCRSTKLSVLPLIQTVHLSVTHHIYDLKAFGCNDESDPSLAVQFQGKSSSDMTDYLNDATQDIAELFSASPLQRMYVVCDVRQFAQWRTALRPFQQLKELYIEASVFASEPWTIQMLLDTLGSTVRADPCEAPGLNDLDSEEWRDLCPSLEVLTLSDIMWTEDLGARILAMVEDRIAGALPLKRLSLRCFNGEKPPCERLLISLDEAVESFQYENVMPPPPPPVPIQEQDQMIEQDAEFWNN